MSMQAGIKKAASIAAVILSISAISAEAQTGSGCQADAFNYDFIAPSGIPQGVQWIQISQQELCTSQASEACSGSLFELSFIVPTSASTPTSLLTPTTAENVEFDVYAANCPSGASTSVYLTWNGAIGVGAGVIDATIPKGQSMHFSLPGKISNINMDASPLTECGASTSSPDDYSSTANFSYLLDDKDAIVYPQANTLYPLVANDFTSTNVPLELVTPNQGAATFQLVLSYQTSGGKGAYSNTVNQTVSSGSAYVVSYPFSSTGGKLSITAKDGSGNAFCSGLNVYIVGSQIPNTEITQQLDALYSTGATPNLLTGIAMVESTYSQFRTRTLFGQSALWPYESYDGGSHVGLMQMPISQSDAWGWKQNISDGANLFSQKIAMAKSKQATIRLLHLLNEPPMLTPVQLENMALVLYGPNASAALNEQYYVVVVTNGVASWVVNTAGNPDGVAYADLVRQSVQ